MTPSMFEVETALIGLTGLHRRVPFEKLEVQGLTKNPSPHAIKLLGEHPDLRLAVFSDPFRVECRRNLALNSSKQAIHMFSIMTGSETDAPFLCINPNKPAIMHLMNCEKKYRKYIDWNAVYNNPCDLAQWWVSIKTKSTPKLFQNCVKLPLREPVEEKETDLYSLAKREDEEAVDVIESFLTGTWETWFDENSKMRPIVEREWNTARGNPEFWKFLSGNKNHRIVRLLLTIHFENINWLVLSANPSIFECSL